MVTKRTQEIENASGSENAIMKNIFQLFQKQWNWCTYFCVGLIILVCAFLMSERQTMSPNWTGPYLSAAANLTLGGEFLVDNEDVRKFKELDDKDAEFNYDFKQSSNLSYYNHNPIGYAYLIRAATTLFPVGDMRAVAWLQILSHLICCMTILLAIQAPIQKWLFAFVYGINPLVLYVVGINFYYAWQAVPAALILFFYLGFWVEGGWGERVAARTLIAFSFAVGLILALMVATRPTTIGYLGVGFLLLVFDKRTRLLSTAPMLIAFCLTFWLVWHATEKNFWHTVYIGLGAYPNSYVVDLSDNEGYELYQQVTGKELGVSFGGNYYKSEIIQEYKSVTKDEFFRIAREDPGMIARNGLLNLLQGFSVGYLNDFSFKVHLAISCVSVFVIFLLVRFKQWFVIVSCLSGLLTFAIYFPPIQAYMFGNYVLLAYGFSVIGNAFYWSAQNQDEHS